MLYDSHMRQFLDVLLHRTTAVVRQEGRAYATPYATVEEFDGAWYEIPAKVQRSIQIQVHCLDSLEVMPQTSHVPTSPSGLSL